MAQAAEDKQRSALFLQMARAWLDLAQKDEINSDRSGPGDKTS